jgi:hypothetical protein
MHPEAHWKNFMKLIMLPGLNTGMTISLQPVPDSFMRIQQKAEDNLLRLEQDSGLK